MKRIGLTVTLLLIFHFLLINSELIAQDNLKNALIEGVAISYENNTPLAGVTLILCKKSGEGECRVNPNLLATTDDDGKFIFTRVPFGEYVILYDSISGAEINKDSINDIAIVYKLGKPKSFNNIFTKEFYDSFGGGDGIIVKKASHIEIEDGKIKTIDGSFTSKKYQYTIDFYDGVPSIIAVNDPELSNIEIKLWL